MLDKRLAATPRARRALDKLRGRPLNFDPEQLRDAGPQNGWKVDDLCRPLPSEPPGEPVTGASFDIARRLMREYAFADPDMVRAVFDPDAELADRNMLLQARFGPLRFFVGCRVSGLVDETRTVDGRQVRVWGWSYRTLAGHFECGQMDYALWKWLDDGNVEFRVHVVSRRARSGNPITLFGFWLVGRREQKRFARRACERMEELVNRELADGGSARADERGAA